MARFGEDLQEERIRQGMSLEAIASLTKVSIRNLRALEEDDFRELPGGVFNKGIVRSYARALGLEEDNWVHRFMERYRASGALKSDDAAWIEFSENSINSEIGTSPDIRLRWGGVLVMGLVFGLLVAGVWLLVRTRL